MSELQFYKRKNKINSNLLKEVVLWIFQLVIVVAVAFLLVIYWGQRTSMIGRSMEPTLLNEQELLLNRFIYNISSPKRGDLIAFKPHGNQNSHFYIKRVIALPGETVQISGGKIYIDGTALVDTYGIGGLDEAGLAEEEMLIEPDEYFVLGDNREYSEDSRFANIGNVKLEDIEGKVWYRIAPFEEAGFIE